ncbi:LysR family transcriptional regulator [Limosilactobacillus gastricus]|uniref:LysR family transcriptional regulator n=1 Tax=Limosilactobacillus gastricus TaxID=227942 RepID=UPI0026EDF7A2|nr:LysR family transcriptional regulator [Limosilactobacillus gastricus]
MLYDKHLLSFLKVTEVGSFNKAAELMYITPSAVIKQINLLENNIGVPLFERTHRGLKLTAAEESLYQDAKRIIQICDETEIRARSAMEEMDATIRIGTSPITPADVLIELWDELHHQNPALKFQLVPYENTPENARAILKNLGNKIDIVAGIFDQQLLANRECRGYELYQEEICVAVPLTNPLSKRQSLSYTDLYGQELMLLKEGMIQGVDELRTYLKIHHPQIKIVDFDFYQTEIFNRCEQDECLLMAISKWEKVHPLLKMIPVEWPYKIPYGILYADNPSKKVLNLLDTLNQIQP